MASKLLRCGAIAALALLATPQAMANTPYLSVDPMIGTSNDGKTFPGASLPFGMIQWSPDTAEGWYFRKDTRLHGFGVTHLSGAGCPVLADMPMLPWSARPGDVRDPHPESVGFSHQGEEAHPGFYRVTLDTGVAVELAVTARAGIARLRFPPGQHPGILINGAGSANTDVHYDSLPPQGREHDGQQLTLRADGILTGTVTAGGFCDQAPSRYTLHVAYAFASHPVEARLWQNGRVRPGATHVDGKRAVAWIDLGSAPEQLVKVGLSWVSEAGAIANLRAELPGWDFDATRRSGAAAWAQALGHVAITGGGDSERTIFYTALYHSLLGPNLFNDTDRTYVGFDWQPHRLEPGQGAQYATFSDWDTYRGLSQFQAWLEPERAGDMAQSIVNDGVQAGSLPRWPLANDSTYVMGGDSAPILLANFHAFGARRFDVRTALAMMAKGASVPALGKPDFPERDGLAEYLRLGYVPLGVLTTLGDGSASETLEFTSADFAIAQLAGRAGNLALQSQMLRRAGNWRNLLDPDTRWIRPRSASGEWLAGFDPERSLPARTGAASVGDQLGFEEGNTAQYSFMIPFDYEGVFQAVGDRATVEHRLNRFFRKLVCWGEPCFNMANEPDFATPYAYTFLGEPWKTAEVVTRIGNETFSASPGGLAGNDDLGATSNVYVWNALGLYPVIPGAAGLVLGTPRFPRADLQIGARRLAITRHGEGIYVQGVVLNRRPWASSWVPLAALKPMQNTLAFKMGTAPGSWATLPGDVPPSMTKTWLPGARRAEPTP